MLSATFRQHWFYRYKLYHFPFWLVYHFVWWANGMDSATEALSVLSSVYVVKYLSYVLWQAVGVYFNLYFLMPRLLERKKYSTYLLSLGMTILVTAAIIVSGYYLTAWLDGRPLNKVFEVPTNAFWHFFTKNALFSTIASMTLAMSIKLAKNYLEARERQQLLEKEKLAMELQFLKSQLSPHFLFNTINSIFVLIHKNPDRASESLAKFSHLLRYQLYECNETRISLEKEINYLERFIELETLRQDLDVDLHYQIERPQEGNLSIAPFLLLPFVENAFKHVSHGPEQNNQVSIHLTFSSQQLCLTVENTTETTTNNQHTTPGGIGLKNVVRRLNLLYPGGYSLRQQAREGYYRSELCLKLVLLSSTESITPASALVSTPYS
ncbi:MAG: histidine kinase [Bacteroidota bacterium]